MAFVCTESGTDYWKVFFFSWFPCGTEGGTYCWMVTFICTESGTDNWKCVFSFRGSRVALKVVLIAGWWLLFAPKVVRTTGRCFSFRGSRVALKVVHIAG